MVSYSWLFLYMHLCLSPCSKLMCDMTSVSMMPKSTATFFQKAVQVESSRRCCWRQLVARRMLCWHR